MLRMILSQGMILTTIGILAGAGLAVAASGFVKDFLPGTRITDPSTFIGVPLLLAAVMLIACWIPAKRASIIDPTNTLRQE